MATTTEIKDTLRVINFLESWKASEDLSLESVLLHLVMWGEMEETEIPESVMELSREDLLLNFFLYDKYLNAYSMNRERTWEFFHLYAPAAQADGYTGHFTSWKQGYNPVKAATPLDAIMQAFYGKDIVPTGVEMRDDEAIILTENDGTMLLYRNYRETRLDLLGK